MYQARETPVLVLGAGINGAAVARELALNGYPVWLVELHDPSYGATSRSSRLIHGGLRYLEYADISLVRESLQERSRLRRLAPQFVEPLRLHIPVRSRWKGMRSSVKRFFGKTPVVGATLARIPTGSSERGIWVVRAGLWLYDSFVDDAEFPPHSSHANSPGSVPHVASEYQWVCSYSDGQMIYPERFVIALLRDADQLAQQASVDFRFFNQYELTWHAGIAALRAADGESPEETLRPNLIVNATGAWGDLTLKQLGLEQPPLLGGTKGSHFITYQPRLRKAIGDDGVYAEASDGRLVFVLPFRDGVLVGTTDERFDQRPDQAVASDEELNYLVDLTNHLFPDVRLSRDDIELHYSGVRPLPRRRTAEEGSIPRGHWIEKNLVDDVPVLTVVGGKLTTCRSLAEDVVSAVRAQFPTPKEQLSSADRPVPGAINYPDNSQLSDRQEEIARRHNISLPQVREIWSLCGTLADEIIGQLDPQEMNSIPGTQLPQAYVRWVIRTEWVTNLDDLVERRLMLVYRPGLQRDTLHALAECLVAEKRLDRDGLDSAIDSTVARLQAAYGKHVHNTEFQAASSR